MPGAAGLVSQLAAHQVSAQQLGGSTCCAGSSPIPAAAPDALALADREEDLASWLTRHGVGREWRSLRRSPRPGPTSAGATGRPRPGGTGAGAGPGVDGEHLVGRPAAGGDEGVDPAHLDADRRGQVLLADGSGVDAAHRRSPRASRAPWSCSAISSATASPWYATTAPASRRSRPTSPSSTRYGPTSSKTPWKRWTAKACSGCPPAPRRTMSSSTSATPARGCHRRWPRAHSRPSSPPRSPARAPASAWTSPPHHRRAPRRHDHHRLATRPDRTAGPDSLPPASAIQLRAEWPGCGLRPEWPGCGRTGHQVARAENVSQGSPAPAGGRRGGPSYVGRWLVEMGMAPTWIWAATRGATCAPALPCRSPPRDWTRCAAWATRSSSARWRTSTCR